MDRLHRHGVVVRVTDHFCDSTGGTEPANRVVDVAGYDVHGQIPEKVPKSETFNCSHCGQKVCCCRVMMKLLHAFFS
jgi:hypothetical protein